MGTRHGVWLAVTFFAIMSISSNAGAQETDRPDGTRLKALSSGKMTGILTDRLTKSQLKAWESILEVVLAKDGEGRPVHPALYELHRQVDTSGHEIQIELSTQRATMCAVGLCRLEVPPESTQKAVVLVRLNLGMIDRALASERSRRADGFIPFAGLSKKERYAEVLGHELAHVVQLLTRPDYRSLYQERQALADRRSQDVQLIGRLTSSIEKPAEAAEIEIWRELAASLKPKM
jgi:hypothetical protein